MSRDRTAMVRLLRQVEYRERRAKLVWSSRYRLVVVGFDRAWPWRVVRRAQARRAFAADPELARRHGRLERYLEQLGLR